MDNLRLLPYKESLEAGKIRHSRGSSIRHADSPLNYTAGAQISKDKQVA